MSTLSRDHHDTADSAGRTRTLIVGAGKIGIAIASLLASAPDYDVTVLDRSERALRTADGLGVHTVPGDTSDATLLGRLAGSHHMVLSGARGSRRPLLRPHQDRASARAVAAMATDAPAVLMPQCGLAPGFVSVAAATLASSFESCVRCHCGSVPCPSSRPTP